MPTPGQAGAATATLGLAAAGGYGAYHYTTSSGETKQDAGKESETKAPTTYIGLNNLGNDYELGVLSVVKNKDKLVQPTELNKDWWNNAFKDRLEGKQAEVTSHFSGVTVGYGDTASLNKACDEAYKKDKDELETKNNTSTIFKDIQKLCTVNPGSTLDLPSEAPIVKPKTDPEVLTAEDVGKAPYQGKLVSFMKESNLSHLLKNSPANKKWWEWRHQEKYAKHAVKKDLDDTFKFVTQAYGENPTPPKSQGGEVEEIYLNQACDAAYKKNKDDYEFQNTYLLAGLAAFCVKEDTEVDVTEPKHTAFESGFNHSTNYPNGVLSVSENRTKLVKSDSSNKEWWNWAVLKRMPLVERGSLSEVFSSVTSVGYAENGVTGGEHQTALNQACDVAYKKNSAELTGTDGTNKLLNEIKKFCTVNPETNISLPLPVLVDDAKAKSTYSGAKLFSKPENKNKVVDPDNPDNKNWWTETFNKKYKTPYDSKKTQLPDPFKAVSSGHATGTASEDSPAALNQACKKAYSKETSLLKTKTTIEANNEKTLLKLIEELCSLEGTTLTEPTD